MSKKYRKLKPKSPEYMEAVIVLRDSLKNRLAERLSKDAMFHDFEVFVEDLDELIEEATEEI